MTNKKIFHYLFGGIKNNSHLCTINLIIYASSLRKIEKALADNKQKIIDAWEEHFGNE